MNSSTDIAVHELAWTNDSGSSWSTVAPVIDDRNGLLVLAGLVALSITSLLSMLGNGLILDRLRRLNSKRRTTFERRNMMILHLCVADLFVVAFNVVPQIGQLATDRFHGNGTLCKFVRYAQVVAMYVSSYVLLSTAIDRYTAICHPLRFRATGNRRMHRLVTGAWIVALLFAVPQIVIFDMRWSARRRTFDCLMMFEPLWTAKLYVMWFTFAVYVLPFTTLTVLYSRVCFVVWHSRRLQAANRESPSHRQRLFDNSSTTSRRSRGEDTTRRSRYPNDDQTRVTSGSVSVNDQVDIRIIACNGVGKTQPVGLATGKEGRVTMSQTKIKTVKFTVAVIVSYLICWGVYFISLLYSIVNMAPQPPPLVLITLLLGSLNSAINPWIYIFFHETRRSSANLLQASRLNNAVSIGANRRRQVRPISGFHCYTAEDYHVIPAVSVQMSGVDNRPPQR